MIKLTAQQLTNIDWPLAYAVGATKDKNKANYVDLYSYVYSGTVEHEDILRLSCKVLSRLDLVNFGLVLLGHLEHKVTDRKALQSLDNLKGFATSGKADIPISLREVALLIDNIRDALAAYDSMCLDVASYDQAKRRTAAALNTLDRSRKASDNDYQYLLNYHGYAAHRASENSGDQSKQATHLILSLDQKGKAAKQSLDSKTSLECVIANLAAILASKIVDADRDDYTLLKVLRTVADVAFKLENSKGRMLDKRAIYLSLIL